MATSPLGFLAGLPVELRLYIYGLVLADPSNYDNENYPDCKIIKQPNCALLRTSRQIRAETLFALLPGGKLCAQASIKRSDKSARWDPVLIPGHTGDSTPFNTKKFGHATVLWSDLMEQEREYFMTNLETAILSVVFNPLFLEICITISKSEEGGGNIRVQFRDAKGYFRRKTGEIAPFVATDDHLNSIMADLGAKVVDIIFRSADRGTDVRSFWDTGGPREEPAALLARQYQKADWVFHHILWKTFKDFTDDKRSAPDHKCAINFPEEGKCTFVWVLTRSGDSFWVTPDLRTLLGVDDPKVLRMPLDFATVLDPRHLEPQRRRLDGNYAKVCYLESLLHFAMTMEERYEVSIDNSKDVLALITKENIEAYRTMYQQEGRFAIYD
ncbi:hypothetical protein E4T39_07296 [Aureobasidium subglaciale]|nr:hypothetical protein E4T39_07296 [Aureobasidium subglaciale]